MAARIMVNGSQNHGKWQPESWKMTAKIMENVMKKMIQIET